MEAAIKYKEYTIIAVEYDGDYVARYRVQCNNGESIYDMTALELKRMRIRNPEMLPTVRIDHNGEIECPGGSFKRYPGFDSKDPIVTILCRKAENKNAEPTYTLIDCRGNTAEARETELIHNIQSGKLSLSNAVVGHSRRGNMTIKRYGQYYEKRTF